MLAWGNIISMKSVCIILSSILLLVVFIVPVSAENYSFSPDAYLIDDDADDTETHLAAKKAKVKKKNKKGTKVTIANPQAEHNVEPQIEQDSSGPPPIYPCDPPVCNILDPMLPSEACNNQCLPETFCQGRHDMRIGHFNIAVCVPPPPM